jgi:fructoselysine-6-phosphate deglycase
MEPAVKVLETMSSANSRALMAAELLSAGSPLLSERALVVMPSLSGTTPETVEALAFCRNAGATVAGLTAGADSPLASGADVTFLNGADNDTSSETFELQSLLFALALMDVRGECEAEPITQELARLPALLVELKQQFAPRAKPIAEQLAAHDWHIISGAGLTWPSAFYYGMCILEEMQWIRTRPVHSSDFFHGTLELVEDGVSVILLKGEDFGRPLVARAEQFAPRYTDKCIVIDTADFDLPGISETTRRLISPVLLATVLERVSAELEVITDHPLSTRRYYRRVEY